jgi:hypothetical protein
VIQPIAPGAISAIAGGGEGRQKVRPARAGSAGRSGTPIAHVPRDGIG